jgi:hypothetical protein
MHASTEYPSKATLNHWNDRQSTLNTIQFMTDEGLRRSLAIHGGAEAISTIDSALLEQAEEGLRCAITKSQKLPVELCNQNAFRQDVKILEITPTRHEHIGISLLIIA